MASPTNMPLPTPPPLTEAEMRKSEFRKMMLKMGIDVEGQDVCHIIAESNRGANSKSNFFMCSQSFNRRIGNRGDALNCYLVGLERCRAAVQASISMSDYQGPSADELFAAGSESFKKIAAEVLNAPPVKLPLPKPKEKPRPRPTSDSPPEGSLESIFVSIRDSLTCPAIIRNGANKGKRCGRERPCGYHDAQTE